MSSSDGQPPLTRRQVRDLERAREAGQAVTGQAVTGAAAAASTPEVASARVVPARPTPADDVSTPVPATARPAVDEQSRSTPPPASVVDPGTGLTRRQMRALRDADQLQSGAAPVPLQPPAPEQRRPLSEALNTVDEIIGADATTNGDDDAAASSSEATEASEAIGSGGDAESTRAESDPRTETDDEAAPGPRRTGLPATGASASSRLSSAPAPTSTPTVFPFALSDPSSRTTGQTPTPASAAGASAPTGRGDRRPTPASPADATRASSSDEAAAAAFSAPVGHWSTQSDEPDADGVSGRSLGPSTGQNNALILTDQQIADVTGALNATGEIIITGSIDLPRSLASTGSQARIDNSDMDRMLEQGDAEQAPSDAEPVRASRAISTHTSTRAVVLAASQPRGTHLPLILGITGGALGLGIIGFIIAGFATGVLG